MRKLLAFLFVFLIVIEATAIEIKVKQLLPTQDNAVKINYPVRLAYVNRLNGWWPAQTIAAGIGVPGYANKTIYNFIALAFWTQGAGPLDVAAVWANPLMYFGGPTKFGSTNDQVQKNLRKLYNDAGMKILISAFGATEFPTTRGYNPEDVANNLGQFVLKNNLDGVDIDWEDNDAMEAGKGEDWLITFHKKLRSLLPNHIITHAPQAPYFKKQHYKNGAYVTVHKAVGNTIDFYNIQFYNQGDTKYDTYSELITNATGYFSGTSLKEIIDRGVPAKKIVIGKPVTPGDASNTGWMDTKILGECVTKAYEQYNWYGGVMFWQYVSDNTGIAINNSCGHLMELCAVSKKCV